MYYIAKYLINLIHEKSTTEVFYELFRNALHRPFTLPKKRCLDISPTLPKGLGTQRKLINDCL